MESPPAVLVVGAGGGIGRALVRQLAADGCRLVLSGRDGDRLAAVADEVDAEAIPTDATDATAVEDLVARAGPLDAAVNLAGSLLLKPAHRTSPAEFRATIDASLTTAFNLVRAVTGHLLADRRPGAIVLMSSAVVRTGMRHHEAIAAAKAGVEGLTRAAAATYADKGIRVNAVAPGMTETPLTAALLASDTARTASEALHPMRTIAQPDEVASAIRWLLDPAQRVVTGQVLAVDAGLGSLQRR